MNYQDFRSAYMYSVHQANFRQAQLDAATEALEQELEKLQKLKETYPKYHEHLHDNAASNVPPPDEMPAEEEKPIVFEDPLDRPIWNERDEP